MDKYKEILILVVKNHMVVNDLTQREIARKLHIDQSEISLLMNLTFNRFSLDRLMHFVLDLGYDIDIIIK